MEKKFTCCRSIEIWSDPTSLVFKSEYRWCMNYHWNDVTDNYKYIHGIIFSEKFQGTLSINNITGKKPSKKKQKIREKSHDIRTFADLFPRRLDSITIIQKVCTTIFSPLCGWINKQQYELLVTLAQQWLIHLFLIACYIRLSLQ